MLKKLKVYKLSFMDLERYSLYSGQIVRMTGALQVIDLAGDIAMKKFAISYIIPPKPMLSKPLQSLKEARAEWSSAPGQTPSQLSPMKLLVASGPFFKEDSIDIKTL